MPGMTARLTLDRTTVVALATGLVVLQLLVFSAGFLLGAVDGVQALTPPAPPLPVRPRPAAPVAPAVPRGGVPEIAVSEPPRPSPLSLANILLPEVTPKPRPAPAVPRLPRTAAAYAAMIRGAAERHSLSPALVEAIARVESGFNPRAVSHKGARGLMQVMPATGRRFGVRSDRLFDPEHNLSAGVAYLAWLSKRYEGNLDFVIAAYNAGEGAVDDYGGIPPYRETQTYVRRVRAALRTIEKRELPPPDQATADPVLASLPETKP
jgi:soluble lytic murein transglycosylase-like protein